MSDKIKDEMLEIDAMKKIIEVFADLDDDTRVRVLKWAADKFAVNREDIIPTNKESKDSEPVSTQEVTFEPSQKYSDLPSLFSALTPGSGSEKVLVAGYWYQACEGYDDLSAQELNTALKHLGHGISNVTASLSSLINTRPQYVMQVRKSGSSQQARKKYRLTAEGIKRVEEMIKSNIKQ